MRAGSIRCPGSSTIARVPVGVDSNRKAARSPYLRANRWRTAIIPHPVRASPFGRFGPLSSMRLASFAAAHARRPRPVRAGGPRASPRSQPAAEVEGVARAPSVLRPESASERPGGRRAEPRGFELGPLRPGASRIPAATCPLRESRRRASSAPHSRSSSGARASSPRNDFASDLPSECGTDQRTTSGAAWSGPTGDPSRWVCVDPRARRDALRPARPRR